MTGLVWPTDPKYEQQSRQTDGVGEMENIRGSQKKVKRDEKTDNIGTGNGTVMTGVQITVAMRSKVTMERYQW